MDAALYGQRPGPKLSTGVPRPEVPPSAERTGPVLNLPAGRQPVRGILLDIEGTTTPIDFVNHVLFPYARARAKAFLDQHLDRKSTRLNSSHGYISYAVFCLKKKKKYITK